MKDFGLSPLGLQILLPRVLGLFVALAGLVTGQVLNAKSTETLLARAKSTSANNLGTPDTPWTLDTTSPLVSAFTLFDQNKILIQPYDADYVVLTSHKAEEMNKFESEWTVVAPTSSPDKLNAHKQSNYVPANIARKIFFKPSSTHRRISTFPYKWDFILPFSGDKVILLDRTRVQIQGLAITNSQASTETQDPRINENRADLIKQTSNNQGIFKQRPTAIIWDLIFPAFDSRGEATDQEINIVRGQFNEEFKKMRRNPQKQILINAHKYRSVGAEVEYFVLTALDSAPVVTMGCSNDGSIKCKFKRKCIIQRGPLLKRHIPSSIAYDSLKQTMLIGYDNVQTLEFYRFNSCMHITYEKSRNLPARVKKPNNLFIDTSSRLWISSLEPDDYNNGSIFVWPQNIWR